MLAVCPSIEREFKRDAQRSSLLLDPERSLKGLLAATKHHATSDLPRITFSQVFVTFIVETNCHLNKFKPSPQNKEHPRPFNIRVPGVAFSLQFLYKNVLYLISLIIVSMLTLTAHDRLHI